MTEEDKVIDIKVLRQLIEIFFSDDVALDTFCTDNYPDIQQKFSEGMRHDVKINQILDYCCGLASRRQTLLANIRAQVSAKEFEEALHKVEDKLDRPLDELTESEHIDSKPVRTSLKVLKELLQNPEVQEAVNKFRHDFQMVYEHIDVVKDYKELHDLLQDIEQTCYFPILQAASGYPQSDSTLDFLQGYADAMQMTIDRLQEVANNGNVAPERLQWMKYINRAHASLGDAIAIPKQGSLGDVIGYLERVLTYLSVINDCLNQAAQDLALQRLVIAVQTISGQLSAIEILESEKVTRFRVGVETLAELAQQFTARVDEHNRWQAIDLELQITERDVEKKDMNKLRLFWPDLQAMVAPMCNQANPWSETLARYANEVDKALAAPESKPEEIQKCFRRYRRHALNRFRQVNDTLRKVCGELSKVRDPLNDILY